MSLSVVLLKPIFAKNDIDMLEDKPYIVNAYNKDAFSRYLRGKLFPTDGSISISDSDFDEFMRDYIGMYGIFPKLKFDTDALLQPKTKDYLLDKLIAGTYQPKFMKKSVYAAPPSSDDAGSSSYSGKSGTKYEEALGAGIGLAGQVGKHYVEGNLRSKAGDITGAVAPTVLGLVGGAIGGPVGAGIGAAVGSLVSGGINAAVGTKRNEKNIAEMEGRKSRMNAIGNGFANANTFKQIDTLGKYMSSPIALSAGKDGFATNKMHRLSDKLYNNQLGAFAGQVHGLLSGIKNSEEYQARAADYGYNSSAFGGPLMFSDNVDPSTAVGYDFMNTYLTNRKGNDLAKGSTLSSPFAGVSSNMLGNTMANGGKIHIKHPGRLTALKKRTGKTEAQLWAEGDPEVRKMINFARQARRWKKAYGGYLDATNNLFAEGGLLGEDNIYALGGESFPSDMTLDEAYAKAREKGQEYFYFNGKRYSTGLTSGTKTYAEGGEMAAQEVAPTEEQMAMDSQVQQQEGQPELVYEAGQEFPSGIWRFPDGTFQAANAKGERVTFTEEQVRAYIEMDQQRKAQAQQQQQFAEGGPIGAGAGEQAAAPPQEGVSPEETAQIQQAMQAQQGVVNPQEQQQVPQEEMPQEQPQEDLPELGEVLDVTPEEAQELKAMGYEFKVIEK